MAARAYIGGGDPVAPQRATGPYRPWGGRQAPVARWVGDRPPFFCQGPRCEFEEKNYTLGLSPYEGAIGGLFLKYCKTDIYF